MYTISQQISNNSIILALIICLTAVITICPDNSHAMTRVQEGASAPAALDNGTSLNAQTVQKLLDELLPQQLAQYHIPGAAVAVVKDGEVIFTGGYGSADLEQQQPVDGGKTLFRTGSVAKLFVWTAVMQLEEQGKLDLNADINTYLSDFQIPDTYSEPITLHALMTHTAGFEDGPTGMMLRQPEDLEPLGTFLARKVPARIYPPGQVAAYSNYGTALASYIVERVSDLTFEEYVGQNILTPLGMQHSTFFQPVPAALAGQLATGYAYQDGAFLPQPFEVFQISPAGGASATASDMAHFMIAHLSGGQYKRARILEADTVELMHQIHFRSDPRVTGIAYGFYEMRVNDHLLLTHGGDTSFFRSQLALFPEENLGLYVVYNAPGGASARQEIIQAFFDRFYPVAPTEALQTSGVTTTPPMQWTGRYISSRRSETTIEKTRLLFQPLYQPITIAVDKDGSLKVDYPLARSHKSDASQSGEWTAIAPDLYVQSDGRNQLLFREDSQGNRMLHLDSVAPRAFDKLSRVEELLFQPLMPLGLMILLIGVMIFSFFDRQALPAARWFAVGTAGVVLMFLLGLAAFAIWGFSDYLYGELQPIWWIIFALPIILLLLTVGLAISTFRTWPEAGVIQHIPYAISVLAAAGLLWWANYWNLIGWRF